MIRFEIEREGMSWGEIMAAGQVVRESRTLSAAWQLTAGTREQCLGWRGPVTWPGGERGCKQRDGDSGTTEQSVRPFHSFGVFSFV